MNVQQISTPSLRALADSHRRTIANPYASNDAASFAERELKAVERELTRRGDVVR